MSAIPNIPIFNMTCRFRRNFDFVLKVNLIAMALAFHSKPTFHITSSRMIYHDRIISTTKLFSDWNDGGNSDSNQWRSSDDDQPSNGQSTDDWQEVMARRADGSFWSTFEPSQEKDESQINDEEIVSTNSDIIDDRDTAAEAWLQTLASLSAEEVEFNLKEADRADKARQMAEWGFDSEIIANTLGVATNTDLEKDDIEGMQKYREESFLEEIDLATVESHTTVEIDEETLEPVRARMVYVDEHTCIGCTNCAMIAQSTFYMNPEHGRARVFQQWGDDDETIQIAIETCPVDCIHYIPYDELVSLEIDRRGQNINFKARLVSQAENGNALSHRVGGTNGFTAPQQISGNMGSRCNNCPTRGCKTCPMYGVGKNPEYERKEQERKQRMAKRKLQKQRELDEKSIDL